MTPVIFIPGIEATNLVNANSFGFESVWKAFDNIGTSLQTRIMGPYLEERLQERPLYDERIESSKIHYPAHLSTLKKTRATK